MKRILFLVLITSVLLAGCKSSEEFLEGGIQELKDTIISIVLESRINEYLEGAIEFEHYDTIVDDEKTIYMYNIILPIKPSYLELDSSKQYALLSDSTQEIFNFQGDDNRRGRPKGKEILNTNGERIKYQSLILYFGDKKNDTFKISLDNEEVKTFRVDNDGKISNIIFANISNEEFVILRSGNILREGEYVKQGEWAFKKTDSNYELNEPNKPNQEVFIDSQTKEFLEWQVKSGEWNKQGK